MRGRFLIIDGPDGSGKGLFLKAMKDEAKSGGKKILDLHTYWEEHGRHPDIEAIGAVDLILSSEPTYIGEGKRIREDLIRTGSRATAIEIAEAYARDRKELYSAVIKPALKAGIDIIQSRGVTTSIVYQPIDAAQKGESLSVEKIVSIPGNAFCLEKEALPDEILILTVGGEELMRRLANRTKQDDALFETLAFQEKALRAFTSGWFREFFRERGTEVLFFETDTSIEESRERARSIYRALFTPRQQ